MFPRAVRETDVEFRGLSFELLAVLEGAGERLRECECFLHQVNVGTIDELVQMACEVGILGLSFGA